MAHVVFAAETLSVAAVVSDPAVLGTPCLERSFLMTSDIDDARWVERPATSRKKKNSAH